MTDMLAMCGLDCRACDYREKMSCPGCVAAAGKIFWGECDLAKCCIAKGHEHCGKCNDFPCATLNEYSYSEGEGDNGERIRNLIALISESQ